MLRIKATFMSLVFIQFDMSVDMKIINIISSSNETLLKNVD